MRLIARPAALLALAALASCGGGSGGNGGSDATGGAGPSTAEASRLFPDDFKTVCSGASVSAAAAYNPSATAHKALYFATYHDDLLEQSSVLPRDWTVPFAPGADALRAIDLVVCARRTAAHEVKICDGYQNNGSPTQNRVRWHTATYELSVREARTGRTIAQRTAEATDSNCPMLASFEGNSDTVDDYALLPDTVVADFVRPHIAH
jgi:hypothetical protein